MKMVIGGAYQGKLAYARNTWKDAGKLLDGAVCSWEELKDCGIVCHLEEFIRRGLADGLPMRELPEYFKKENPDVILVCREIGYGIVPMDAFEREYREAVGRICTQLAAMSDEVHRVVCGIGTVIK